MQPSLPSCCCKIPQRGLRWQEYFNKLLNGNQRRMPLQEELLVFISNEDVPLPTTEEVRANQKLKNNKCTCSNSIPAQLLKAAGINVIDGFHQLLFKIWNVQTMRNKWNQTIICPIHKKEC